MNPPSYFDVVRAEAEHDWSVWQNPRHGNPVRQLFKQVQSPKHVLSELLQNADDAGASSAEATLDCSTFTFHHNGQDFDQDQFASLCRFAFSNKRTIHTIGFRGIGFKSTFSLGKVVHVETPTLRVLFREETFTLPEWSKDGQTVDGTRITVSNVDPLVEGDLNANFEQWGAEPYSLLFLKTLRRLTLPSCDIHWEPDEQAHFQVGHWYKTGTVSAPVLLCRSESQHFPAECLDEIKQERNLDDADIAEFPPCSVELVVGAPGRLYVVLPTGIELDLGFGVNAPFIQDPGRYGIKPPSTSPTNRWLLERVGVFAAEAMLRWLSDTGLSQVDRAGAYALMPRRIDKRASLEEECLSAISDSFWRRLGDEAFVLSTDGDLCKPEDSVLLPRQLAGVWSESEYARISGHENRAVASWEISTASRTILREEAKLTLVSLDQFVVRLTQVSPKNPSTLDQTARLWIALSDQIGRYHTPENLSIVPVQGSEFLLPAADLCRPPAKPKALASTDWNVLLSVFQQVAPDWLSYMDNLSTDDSSNEEGKSRRAKLSAVLDKFELGTSTDVAWIVGRACELASNSNQDPSYWNWLAEIHAATGLKASPELRFELRNGRLIGGAGSKTRPVMDLEGGLDELVPESVLSDLLLSDRYHQAKQIDQQTWMDWLSSSQSGVSFWIAPQEKREKYSYSRDFEKALPHSIGRDVRYHYTSSSHYTYQRYWFTDYEFCPFADSTDADFLNFLLWNVRAMTKVDPKEWDSLSEIVGYQTPTGGGQGRRVSIQGDVTATWIRQLKSIPCLPDTKGNFRMPHELYLRSEKTRGLVGIEAFVAEEFDTPQSRKLLVTIGVRDAPANLDSMINRLRALSQTPNPPREELQKLYSQIDYSLPHLSWDSDQFGGGREQFVETFRTEALVFTEEQGWLRSGDVFMTSGSHGLPDVPVVLANVASLQLWVALEVQREPTWEDVLQWVSSLPYQSALDQPSLKRLQKCMTHDADAIWDLGGWLSLAGEWVQCSDLEYELAPSSFRARDIVPSVRRRTADFTFARPKGSALPSLEAVVDNRVSAVNLLEASRILPPWLLVVASRLRLITVAETAHQLEIRKLANVLCETKWQPCSSIATQPYLNGAPLLTTDRELPVHWDVATKTLYVTSLDAATEADELAKIFAREFAIPELEKALNFCFERTDDQVNQCLGRLFKFDSTDKGAASEETTEGPEDEAQPEPTSGVGVKDGAPPEPSSSPRPPRKATTVRQHKRNHPSGLIEDYAYQNGFEADGPNSFIKGPNQSIRRVESKEFPWEYTLDGQVVRRLYSIDAHIGSPKIELSYEQWEMLRGSPKKHALILVDENHLPTLVEGQWLLDAVQQGALDLRISQYRLARQEVMS